MSSLGFDDCNGEATSVGSIFGDDLFSATIGVIAIITGSVLDFSDFGDTDSAASTIFDSSLAGFDFVTFFSFSRFDELSSEEDDPPEEDEDDDDELDDKDFPCPDFGCAA